MTEIGPNLGPGGLVSCGLPKHITTAKIEP